MATATLTPLVHYILAVGPTEPDAALLSRFARIGDESAFAELVRRHGPAVLGACRRILRDGHAAEDAFQATFLLLARKAGALHQPERLATWLYGVACRTAMKLRSRLCRQHNREHPFDESVIVPPDEPDADLGPELDAAIQQLPSKYRVPFVLCYLQGLTNAEAAVRLGCPTNTVATRLSRARERLRFRLTKQGLTAAVSASLVAATARSAAALAAGGAGASAEILTLMEGVRTAMMWKKAKLIVAAVAVVALTGFGAGRFAFRASADQPAAGTAPVPAVAAVPKPATADERIPPVDLNVVRNFAVTGTTAELGLELAIAAEYHRKDLAKLWLGKELPDWKQPCPVRVTIAPNSPGSSTTFEFGKVFRIGGMTLTGTREQLLVNLIPHEVTHTILADYFRQPLPRWADEGAASLSESAASQDQHEHHCRQVLNAGRAMRLQHLFKLKEYPNDVLVLYVQGHSVTQFLVARKDRATFLAFVKVGMKDGWEAAAKRYYDFPSINDLEAAWIASLRQPRPPAAPVTSPTSVDTVTADTPSASVNPPPAPTASLTPPQPLPAVGSPLPPMSVPIISKPAPTDAPMPVPPPSPTGQPQPAQPVAMGLVYTAGGWGAPTVVLASIDKEGMLVCNFSKMIQYVPMTSYLPDKAGNGRAARTSYVRKSIQEDRCYRLDQVQVIESNGKPVEESELVKRLGKETAVLFIESGTISPQLLPLLKDGTLIIKFQQIPPVPARSVPPIAPAPAIREQ